MLLGGKCTSNSNDNCSTHCKKLAPEYAKAAAILAEKDLYIAKIDTTEHVKTGKKFGITAFPTLKFF